MSKKETKKALERKARRRAARAREARRVAREAAEGRRRLEALLEAFPGPSRSNEELAALAADPEAVARLATEAGIPENVILVAVQAQYRHVEWVPALGLPRYEVSRFGEVRLVPGLKRGREAPMKVYHRPNGEIIVNLGYVKRGVLKRTNKILARLVLDSFTGGTNRSATVFHRDGNRANCALTNLLYVTRKVAQVVRTTKIKATAIDDEAKLQETTKPEARPLLPLFPTK